MIAPKPIHLVNVALALALAWACWGAFVSPPPPPRIPARNADGPSSAPGGGGASARRSRGEYQVIEQADIFRNKDVVVRPPEPTPIPPTPVPLPPMELQLQGTTVSPRDKIVRAIIYNKKTRKTETYVKNDVIPDTGGAKIVEIARNRVVIDRQGTSESLESYPPEIKALPQGTGERTIRR